MERARTTLLRLSEAFPYIRASALRATENRMFGLGMGEMLVILVIVLIIFGAGRLPELGEGLGKGIRNFRKATSEPDSIDVTPPNPASPGGAAESKPDASAEHSKPAS
jgi:sec-independent protein translocase protein TatA